MQNEYQLNFCDIFFIGNVVENEALGQIKEVTILLGGVKTLFQPSLCIFPCIGLNEINVGFIFSLWNLPLQIFVLEIVCFGLSVKKCDCFKWLHEYFVFGP